jgi:N,N'-diacetyllegionaminate synthase
MKIIAETAFNHCGSIEYLKKLISAASRASADYVTVQIFDLEYFCEKKYERYDIYKNTCFNKSEWKEVFLHCKEQKISLIPCPLDIQSLKFCYENGHQNLKIHATDITNVDMLSYISERPDIKIFLETQCATNIDIQFALSYINNNVVCLLHGFSDYPTETQNLRLNSLGFLKEKYGYPVGFADHSTDTTEIPLMCLAKGVEFLEKHITISRDDRNYDWQVSLEEEDFLIMVKKVHKYYKSLGPTIKHPTKKEANYRNVLYKKYKNDTFIRSDNGNDYLTSCFNSLTKKKAGIALIARLKSKRLHKKVLKPFHKKSIILDLYENLEKSKYSCFLATSTLKEDDELCNLFLLDKKNYFRGNPNSVLERMLSLALQEKWGAVFRVTGDNPLTNVDLLDNMVDLLIRKDLDYVRVNNCPFGTTAELFSTKYLWELYLNMDNTDNTEYLSWYVLLDKNCKKGSIDILSQKDLKYHNFSIDYEKDYDFCKNFLKYVDKDCLDEITLKDMQNYISKFSFQVDKQKEVKLPNNIVVSLQEYLKIIDKTEYIFREKREIL